MSGRGLYTVKKGSQKGPQQGFFEGRGHPEGAEHALMERERPKGPGHIKNTTAY